MISVAAACAKVMVVNAILVLLEPRECLYLTEVRTIRARTRLAVKGATVWYVRGPIVFDLSAVLVLSVP